MVKDLGEGVFRIGVFVIGVVFYGENNGKGMVVHGGLN